jgi:hypothetical protein
MMIRSAVLAAVAAGGVVLGLAVPAAAHEAGHLINGASIKPHTIAGDRLKNNTVTGAQVKESTLGTVPRAGTASVATSLPGLVWVPLVLHNSWTAYGHGYDAPAYAIDTQGIVHLRGAMDGSPSSSVAFSFPSSILSPEVQAQYPVAANNATIALMTVTDGAFVPLDGPATAGSVASFTDIDGITFAVS